MAKAFKDPDDSQIKLFVEIAVSPEDRKVIDWLLGAASKDETREDIRRAIHVEEDCVFATDGFMMKAIPLDQLECLSDQVGKVLRPMYDMDSPHLDRKPKVPFELVDPPENRKKIKIQTAMVEGEPSAEIKVNARILARALDSVDGRIRLRVFDADHENANRVEIINTDDDYYAVLMGIVTHPAFPGRGWKPSRPDL